MRHIKTEIRIDVPPERVWKVLLDFDNYPNWNPFIKSIQGERAIGQKLEVKIQPPDGKEMIFRPEILVFEANKEFKWLGKAFVKGIFDGEHYFVLEVSKEGGTKFVHGERFNGLLVGLMGKTLDKTKIGFELMNEALKDECENRA